MTEQLQNQLIDSLQNSSIRVYKKSEINAEQKAAILKKVSTDAWHKANVLISGSQLQGTFLELVKKQGGVLQANCLIEDGNIFLYYFR